MSAKTTQKPAEQKRDDLGLRSRSATLSSVNAEKRTVDLVWTTGASVLRNSWDGAFYEELSLDPSHVRMDRLNNGAPFLADHNGYRVADTLGVIIPGSAKLGAEGGTATIRFAKAEDDPEADKIFRKIQDKIIQNVSVGYRVWKMEKVEGGDAKTPTMRATDWEPYEISAVAMGADDQAGFRSLIDSRGEPQEHNKMNEEEKKAAEKLAEEKRQADMKTVAEGAARAERERQSGIRLAVRAVKLDEAFAEKLCNDNVSLDEARKAVLNEMATRSEAIKTETHVTLVDSDPDKKIRGMSAALFERGGRATESVRVAKASGKEEFKSLELDSGEFRGITLENVARWSLDIRGVAHRHINDKQKLFSMALEARSGYGAASDFSVLLENVMYKTLRAQYSVTADTWKRWCGTDSVSDFRNSNRYLRGTFGVLDVLPENAEYIARAIPDGQKTAINTQTYGGKIGISRQALINDDMGAIAAQAADFGRSAGLTIEKAAYALLALNSGAGPTMADTNPFFHTSRGNVTTGAALSVTALDLDRQAFRKQQDISSNEYLDLHPSIMLVSTALAMQADVLNKAPYNNDGGSGLKNFQQPNGVQNMFTDIVSSPRVDAISTTRRWLFTAEKQAFLVVFLDGSGNGPTMESRPGFDVDGIEWKCRVDFKVNAFDPKLALTNAGV